MAVQKIICNIFEGKQTGRPPVWFMRQAGRVLPSYMEMRKKYGFKHMMDTPELAATVTLLPVDELGVDAAILFSDILVVPEALGMELIFDPKPRFKKALKELDEPEKFLKFNPGKLENIYKTIDLIIQQKSENTALIGFCGAPFTVLCYMYEGLGTDRSFSNLMPAIYNNKKRFKKIIDQITEMSIEYAMNQAKHGIDIFQLFDTHAGLIPFDLFEEMFLPSIKKILNAVRNLGIHTIYFPKGIGVGIEKITHDITDGISIDWQTPLNFARKLVGEKMILQGNMDPRLLLSSKKAIDETFIDYLKFGRTDRRWIFNLGHGFTPDIPFENAKYLVDKIKTADWQL